MSDDLIRRSDAIKFLNDYLGDCYRVSRRNYEKTMLDAISMDFEAVITNIPAVEPKQVEWIPCSERLPEKAGIYLCTVVAPYRNPREMRYAPPPQEWADKIVNATWRNTDGDYVFDWFVEAWQPLPEPWKGVDDE